MPLARRRIGGPGVIGPRPVARTAAVVGTAAVVSHGVARAGPPRPAPNLTLTASALRPNERKGVLHGIQTKDTAPGARCRSGCRRGDGSPREHAGREQQQAPADDYQDQAQYAPPPADPADEIEHLAQLHTSGALTDEEFAAAKAKALGT